MTRFDPFSLPHKAVRSLWFEAVRAVAGTDFDGDPELPSLAAGLRRAMRLARLHADGEDWGILPHLHELAPELAADLEASHARVEGLARKLDLELLQLERASDAERGSLGRRIHQTLDQLVGEELAHLRHEETRATRVLWAHLTDGELRALQGRILAALEPSDLGEWIAVMLTAGNPRERQELLASLGSALSGVNAAAEAVA